ncbi:MAG: hypothetical protein MI919_32505, partial [Holophagales bacterium]|nr:hypothetical protein [Holophagales bacterium]
QSAAATFSISCCRDLCVPRINQLHAAVIEVGDVSGSHRSTCRPGDRRNLCVEIRNGATHASPNRGNFGVSNRGIPSEWQYPRIEVLLEHRLCSGLNCYTSSPFDNSKMPFRISAWVTAVLKRLVAGCAAIRFFTAVAGTALTSSDNTLVSRTITRQAAAVRASCLGPEARVQLRRKV